MRRLAVFSPRRGREKRPTMRLEPGEFSVGFPLILPRLLCIGIGEVFNNKECHFWSNVYVIVTLSTFLPRAVTKWFFEFSGVSICESGRHECQDDRPIFLKNNNLFKVRTTFRSSLNQKKRSTHPSKNISRMSHHFFNKTNNSWNIETSMVPF